MFRDLGLPEDRGYDEDRARHIIHTLVNNSELEARVMARFNRFLQDTSVTYDSKNVPTEKKRRDAEDVLRHMYLGYTKPCAVSEEDYVTDKTVTINSGYAFLYALDLAVQSNQRIEDLLEGKDLYDPLLFKEKMGKEFSATSEVVSVEKRPDF